MVRQGDVLALQHPLPLEVISLLYAWADRTDRAVIIRNRSLAKLSILTAAFGLSSGIPVFRHCQRPCLYATIAGIVVGVTQRDRRWELMVDDGTHVLDVCVHTERGATTDAANSSEPEARLGDIVKVTGRIWKKQFTSPQERTTSKVGLDAENIVLINDDPTAEVRHNLRAHELEAQEYGQPFTLPSEAESNIVPYERKPRKPYAAHIEREVLYVKREEPYVSSSATSSAPKFNESPRNAHCESSTSNEPSPPHTRTQRTKRSRGSDGAVAQSSAVEQRPSSASVAPSKTRRLRAPNRLSDSECTQSLFRLHVQKVLTDYCSGGEKSTDAANAQHSPPLFTISLLQRVQPLAELSNRVVSVLLKNRAKRLAQKQLQQQHRSGAAVPPSTESKDVKTQRLFQWCIRELVLDGFIVVADAGEAGPGAEMMSVGTHVHPKLAKQLVSSSSVDLFEHDDDDEYFQLVTPGLLVAPLQQVMTLRHISPASTTRMLLHHLHRTDEKWKHINEESVQEAREVMRR